MEFDVEVMDSDFSPGEAEDDIVSSPEGLSGPDLDQAEGADSSETVESVASDDTEEAGGEEVAEAETQSEIVVYDDSVLLEKMDVLHQDAILLFTILLVTFARACFHSYRDKIMRSDRALGR